MIIQQSFYFDRFSKLSVIFLKLQVLTFHRNEKLNSFYIENLLHLHIAYVTASNIISSV